MAISHNDAILAGLTMLGFGLGTLPAMIGMGLFGASLKQWIQKRTLRKMAGGLMVIVGLGTAALPAYAIVKNAVMSDINDRAR